MMLNDTDPSLKLWGFGGKVKLETYLQFRASDLTMMSLHHDSVPLQLS
jgi:hypothetical protein